MKFFSNKDIAKMLREIAAAYCVKGGNNFKIIAYNNAADSIEAAPSELKDLWEDGKLNTIESLGKSIQTHLDELFKTGKVAHFEEIKRDLPSAMFSYLNITGMGPKTAYTLASTLNLKNLGDLEKAAKEGKIRMLPGFGQKSEEDILKSTLEYKTKSKDRMPMPEAFNIAQRVIAHIKTEKSCEKIVTLGSLRRMVATIGDVDIGVASNSPEAVISHFKKFREVSRVLSSGDIASSVLLKNGVQVDLKVMPSGAFGALLQHFTGSKYHNVKLRQYALKKGMSLSEHGIKYKGELKRFETEESFYDFLDLGYIEPELREDTGEVEAAQKRRLPNLINTADIKGDLHIHSNFPIEPSHDMGNDSFDVLVKKAESLKYEYIGLSDHSPAISTHTNSKIIDLIKARKAKIEQLKYSHKNIRILNLLEIDILTNGEFSVPENGLRLLDGAIAGIHSSHGQSKAKITKRLLNAINAKQVKVISHPTGRLLLTREPYDADWDEVFKACAKTNTFLEINSWPTRLDLSDVLVKKAISYGVRFVINTDAHDQSHMDNMHFGVSVARRGWATKENIVNSYPWLEFKSAFDIS